MPSLDEEKRLRRAQIRALRPSPGVMAEESRRLCGHLLASDLYRHAVSVAAYWPLAGEADVGPLLRDVLASGRHLALPLTARDLSLSFLEVADLSCLVPDAWGIPAPDPARCPPFPMDGISLILVPLLAVDQRGCRLGKGGGCYDRYFAAHPALLQRAAGAALGYQLADRLPAGGHDCRLPRIATPDGLICLNTSMEASSIVSATNR
ncbi:MAG: 5-formyltetrahydrofolate cyclo-ligase [Clostridia bacterium]|nr:5-formyltetrahydrofolate cyclo-ligase [Clostridia bacterium]